MLPTTPARAIGRSSSAKSVAAIFRVAADLRKRQISRAAGCRRSSSTCSSSASVDSGGGAAARPARFDLGKIRQELFENWMTAQSKSPEGLATTARYCCFTHDDAMRSYKDPGSSWHWLDREMSSNLAGETGAVAIYAGALAAMRLRPSAYAPCAAEFCDEHRANESAHLDYFSSVLPRGKRTALLPVWRLAGWTLGFSSTLAGGARGLYVTVEAVETFVEEHFQEQIVPLREEGRSPELVRLLEYCCEDEAHHREDAARRLLRLRGKEEPPNSNSQLVSGWWVKPWTQIVQKGSALAAEVARRI